MTKQLINEAKRMQQLAGITAENINDKTYAIYLGTNIIYSHLPNERLKSVLYSLINDLGEDLSNYTIVQNGTNHTKPADELGWDLSNIKPFDNIDSLRTKIDNIANGSDEDLNEDHEVKMANSQLDNIIEAATKLKQAIGDTEKDLPAWAQDHLSKAEDFITQVAGGYKGDEVTA